MADAREQVPFRLRPDDYRRLKKVCRRTGGTLQSFIEGAVLREINELEARQQHRKDEQIEERTNRFAISTSTQQPAGLGLAERLQPVRAQVNDDREPSPAPVVVNIGGSAGGSVGSNGNDIERLAAFVVAGRDFERSMRLRTAVGILHATSSSEEERRVLAARLDETIAAKTKAAVEEVSGGAAKLARVAFDKLKDLF